MLWITKSIINKSFKKFIINKKISIQTSTSAIVEQNYLQDQDHTEVANNLTEFSNQSNVLPSNQREGGRPKDSICKKKKFIGLAKTAFIN